MLGSGKPAVVVGLDVREASFEDIGPGDYVATVQLVRDDGSSDVAQLQAAFNVPTAATAPVPVVIDVAVA